MTSAEVREQVGRIVAAAGNGVGKRLAEVPAEQRWQVVADAYVRGIPAVPDDVQHRQAAVALVTNALGHEGWADVESPGAAQLAADSSIEAAAKAVETVRQHYERYAEGSAPPVPTVPPNKYAPPLPLPTAPASTTDPAFRAAMTGQVSPATGPAPRGGQDSVKPAPGVTASDRGAGRS